MKVTGRREESVLQPDGSSLVQPVLLCEFVSDSGDVARKVQWIGDAHKRAARVLVPGDLLKPDNTYNPDSLKLVWGWTEPACAELPPGTSVQFERFGFSTLDKVEGETLSFIQISD